MQLAAIHMPLTTATLIVGGRGVYYGYVADETAGAAASCVIYDGINDSGLPIDYVRLAALGNKAPWYGTQGIHFEQGLYIGAHTGAMRGQIFFVAQTVQTVALLVDEAASDRRIRPYLTQVTVDDMVGQIYTPEES